MFYEGLSKHLGKSPRFVVKCGRPFVHDGGISKVDESFFFLYEQFSFICYHHRTDPTPSLYHDNKEKLGLLQTPSVCIVQ